MTHCLNRTKSFADQVILQEFFIVFDDDEKVNLEQSLLDLEPMPGADQRRGALDNLYRQYHSAKGSAGFINALILSALAPLGGLPFSG